MDAALGSARAGAEVATEIAERLGKRAATKRVWQSVDERFIRILLKKADPK